ncbi:MAG: ATP-binding protein [Gammaproteobacteria bacterium]|nr:ATP-binding protein [Gammaproteobacteria bacterium]|tara:strand:- start:5011 stop:5685 length:675 start_codon:yes stop_codon:yes gene_type:complete
MSIKKIIAFGSAKGGVGKSSITASIALSLSKHKRVGILDADIYGPNQNILFNISSKNKITNNLIQPAEVKNIKVISMGNILNYDEAAIWRGPMLSGAIKKLIHKSNWGKLDYLLIDMPPGTGDPYLTIFKELDVNEFILISTPNGLAISDSQKTISLLKKLNVNILGYIHNNIFNNNDFNMDFFNINDIKHLGTYIFDKNLHNFNCEYYSKVSNQISKIILSDV